MSDYNNDQYSNQQSRGAYNPDGFSGGNMTQGGSYGGGGGYRADDDDLRGAARHAEEEAGDSGDSSLFSSVLGMLGQKKQSLQDEDLDEQDAVRSHQQFFGGGGAPDRSADTSSMGSAAAMQALKMFSGGGSGNSQSGNSQNAFVGMAMAQASKLFDQQNAQGNVAASADKESVVQKAGEMALKMYLKSQGGNSGLMGMAAKFL